MAAIDFKKKTGQGFRKVYFIFVIAAALGLVYHLFSLPQFFTPDDNATMVIAELRKELQDVKDELAAGNNKGAASRVSSEENAKAKVPVVENSLLATYENKGFNPVFIFSNATRAAAEIPAKPSFAQVKQDTIILALMNAIKKSTSEPAFFVDLASNHFHHLSNTVALEQKGWKGLCIEGNQRYWYDLARHRKCTIVGAFVGGTESEDGKQVKVLETGVSGGIIGKGMDNRRADAKSIDRDLVSISTIFKATKVPNIIDYLSLDVEGAESLVMADFPWDQYTFRFMTVERPKDDLVAKFEGHGYRFVATIGTFGEQVWMHEKDSGISFDEASDIIKANGPNIIIFARDKKE